MRVLMINVVCGIRSTGRICTDLADALASQGDEVKIAYGRGPVPPKYQKYAFRIGNGFDVSVHGIESRLFDTSGFGSKRITNKFVKWIQDFDPDIIHLHNLHGYYINISILFDYLRKCGKKIIWTLHDNWAFTGHAAYCEMANCEKWIIGCNKCPKKNAYPKSYIVDRSSDNWKKKKQIMSHVPNLQIVTPSVWLSKMVKKSFLAEYPVTVINNSVDATVFKPIKSNIKEKYGIENKKIVLGVASAWGENKGFDDFISLSKRMNSDFQIIMVGLSKNQIRKLPKNIIGIENTNSVEELVKFYSAADVFVNPTYEDNYPTTNLEAIACNTPVITYNTGGSIESAEQYGVVVNKGDIRGLLDAIYNADKIVKTDRPERVNSTELYKKIYKM